MNKILISLGLILSLVGPATAAGNNITVTCAVDGPCTMAPNPNDPLFYETNMLPGDTVTKKLTVINQDETQACDLRVKAFNDRRSPSGTDFPSKLFSVITKDGSPFLSNTIQSIYDQQQIDLTTVPASGSVVYDWTVTFDPNSGNYYQVNETIFDFEVVFSCGDEVEAQCHLTKSNNRQGFDNRPGDRVIYTLRLLADTDIQDGYVNDLPPRGFRYLAGTWTAHSSVRGNLRSGGVTTEPNYHSPGSWSVGDMLAGEVVTLTYEAQIGDDQLAGMYPDLACLRI